MMAESGHVEVFVQLAGKDVAAGDLWMHRAGRSESATFAYRTGFLSLPEAYELDPELSLQTGQFQTPVGRAVFGAFSDTTPDRWGRRLIQRAEAVAAREEQRTARTFAERDYLLGARDDMRQGALRYRHPGDDRFVATEEAGVPALLALGALLNAADALERDDPTSEQLRLLLRGGSSLGGARPKAHVIGTDGHPCIAKFPSPKNDDWDINRWESVALTLARKAGIVTADHELHRVDGKPVTVLRRFDRLPSGHRLGFISAMTLLSGRDGQIYDYLDIAEQLEVDSERPTEDLRELWTRCAYGRLISNTDDHLRNHGFLRGQAGWRLSPALRHQPEPVPRGVRDQLRWRRDGQTRAAGRQRRVLPPRHRRGRRHAGSPHRGHRGVGDGRGQARPVKRGDRSDGTGVRNGRTRSGQRPPWQPTRAEHLTTVVGRRRRAGDPSRQARKPPHGGFRGTSSSRASASGNS